MECRYYRPSIVGGYDSKVHVPGHSTKNAAESFLGSTQDWWSREGFEPRRIPTPQL